MMPFSEFLLVFQWWSALFLVGAAAFPLTKRLFSPTVGGGWPASNASHTRLHRYALHFGQGDAGWYDRGYMFSKAVGMAVVSYLVFVFGTLKVLPFTLITVIVAMSLLFVFGMILPHRITTADWTRKSKRSAFFRFAIIIVLEEIFFFCALLLWSWVKAHEPSIRGLEKFMDFGFMQSIINSSYFPAPDMWWAGGFINYYFFGHMVTAVLTKLSGLDLSVTFNLMLATIFSLCFTMSFSIGVQLQKILSTEDQKSKIQSKNQSEKIVGWIRPLFAGALTALLVTLAGNMQTLYVFTKGYLGDNVVPFWTVLWSPAEFVSHLGEGMLRYWYANATRFIPFTIHEFPSYSFVVSDVHGHVLSIPFVLLAIALLIQLSVISFQSSDKIKNLIADSWKLKAFIFYGFLVGVLLMTNALDGPIYFGLLLSILVFSTVQFPPSNFQYWRRIGIILGITVLMTGLTALPFLIHFKSFAAGIGINCPPAFLANTKIGPFLFEGVEKCQKSPLWMMELLWGFFWFTGIWLFVRKIWQKVQYDGPINRILKVFYIYGIALIVIPEFFYVKDIYPAHFRSNTMFKLGYQAFILWSIMSAFVIVHFLFMRRRQFVDEARKIKGKLFRIPPSTVRFLFFVFLLPQLFLVSIYPIFSIRSYFGELRTYHTLHGLEWLEKEFPDDFAAIVWLKNQIHTKTLPVIVEADGESYTDYNHISAFSGIPTVVGWAVHEWLWRGSYDIVAPRREDVKMIYESSDTDETHAILVKYNVRYIVVGKLEREKYPQLDEHRIASLGREAFRSGMTVVYEVKVNPEVGY